MTARARVYRSRQRGWCIDLTTGGVTETRAGYPSHADAYHMAHALVTHRLREQWQRLHVIDESDEVCS